MKLILILLTLMKDFDFAPETCSRTLIGGVRLPRDLTDLTVWRKTPFDPAHALCDLYMLANTAPGSHKLARGITVDYEAGECLWSNKALAGRWGWRRESVERFMVELEKSEIIRRREAGQYGKVIKLTEFDTEPDTEPDTQRTPNAQPLDHPTGTEGVGDRSRGEENGVGEGEGNAPSPATVHAWAQAEGVHPDFAEEKRSETAERGGFMINGHPLDWKRRWKRYWDGVDGKAWCAEQKKSAPAAPPSGLALADMRKEGA